MKLLLILNVSTLILMSSNFVDSSITTQNIDTEAAANSQDGPPASFAQTQHSGFGQSRINRTQEAYKKTRDSSSGMTTKKSESKWKYSRDVPKEYKRFSGIRYTPIDLAEYIQRTRDEEGVALAIEELLREGLINREEAILYLENIKKELQDLKKQSEDVNTQNTSFGVASQRISKLKAQPLRAFGPQRILQQTEDKRFQATKNEHMQSAVRASHKETEHRSLPEQLQQFQKELGKPDLPHQHNHHQQLPFQLMKLLNVEQKNTRQSNVTSGVSTPTPNNINNDTKWLRKQEDKSANDDKIMENLVFQLAKDMFIKSMTKDNASAEQLLTNFADFLERELSDKRFSKETQNKIMNTMSAALVESLRERLYVEN